MRTNGQEVPATTFLVKRNAEATGLWTSTAYVAHIISGLRARQAPPEYVEHVITAAIATNERARERADEETRGIAELRQPF